MLVRRATSRRAVPPEVEAAGLAACPDTPNCVFSQADSEAHFIDPIRWSGSGSGAIAAAARVVESHAQARTCRQEAGYLHATYRIPVFRFVDDVEFLWDDEDRVLHVRSASRVGRSDLGVNRRRVERIRRAIRRASENLSVGSAAAATGRPPASGAERTYS